MSILITGMNMPTEGGTICVYKINGKFFAARAGKDEIFPIIHIHEPHGRLGDLDELHKKAVRRSEKAGTYDSWYNCADRVISAFDIGNAPTVIPASEEGENTDFWGEEYAEAKGLTEEDE